MFTAAEHFRFVYVFQILFVVIKFV